jgi:hypothetical protein
MDLDGLGNDLIPPMRLERRKRMKVWGERIRVYSLF